MLKLSITLPNNILITLESDGPGPVHEVLAMVLGSVQPDIRPAVEPSIPRDSTTGDGAEKSNGVPFRQDVQSQPVSPNPRIGWDHGQAADGDASAAVIAGANGMAGYTIGDTGDNGLDLNRYSRQAQEDLAAFCLSINPTGDMRRVVVVAEAANRFFGLAGVTADEVGELFDLIGWRRANSFTQTIRNAARTKFGWMERIPGRAGRYAATQVGRSTTLSG